VRRVLDWGDGIKSIFGRKKAMYIRICFGISLLIPATLVLIILAIFMTGCFFVSESLADEVASRAYELRMQGKADEAKILLERALAENPKNEEACYELARIQNYMAVGDPANMESNLKKAQSSIEKAMQSDPKNVIYPFFAGHIAFFQSYFSMAKNQPEVKENVARLCGEFESALKIKPDYYQAMLYLVEINMVIPETMGGDPAKAEQYAQRLESVDEIYGAKARSFLLLLKEAKEQPDEFKRSVKLIGYWKDMLAKHPGNAEALVELGRDYLGANNASEAASCFEEAVRIDPEKRILYLDIGRSRFLYSDMMSKKDPAAAKNALAMSESFLNKYLEIEHRIPLKAFALGVLARVKMQQEDQAKSREILSQAKKLDPYYSKAFGVPDIDLFIPPEEISHQHRYLFLPY
jgi:cytochrome c-type biogenesis protein CcmH/NrfG